MNRNIDYLSVPRPRKVKHVKFIEEYSLEDLEVSINNFADDNPEFKILGIKLVNNPLIGQPNFIGVITYLENTKGVEYEDYPDEPYED